MTRYRSRANRQLDADRRALGESQRRYDQAHMTTDDIRRLILAEIFKADDKAAALTRRDLLATNIPPSSIDEHFRACMDEAEQQRPGLKKRAQEFA